MQRNYPNFFAVGRIQSVITRQMLILLGLLFIALAILATTYLALQRQELRKRAQGAPPDNNCAYYGYVYDGRTYGQCGGDAHYDNCDGIPDAFYAHSHWVQVWEFSCDETSGLCEPATYRFITADTNTYPPQCDNECSTVGEVFGSCTTSEGTGILVCVYHDSGNKKECNSITPFPTATRTPTPTVTGAPTATPTIPSGQVISADPPNCVITGGATTCSSTIQWNTSGVSGVEVLVREGTGAWAVFACAPSGYQVASFIGPHTYTFSLRGNATCSPVGDGIELNHVAVQGVTDTCTPSDCSGVCAPGATCRQVASSTTKQCSCQFPPSPTPTPTPGGTVLALSLNFEGLSAIPVRTTEPVGVTLKSSAGTILGPFIGTLTYASTPTAHFEGSVPLGATVSSGTYQVLIKPRSYLARNFVGIAITQNATTTLPFDPSPIKLFFSCDIAPDNKVDMLDIQRVYTDIKKGKTESFADITHDGFVDIFDHNYCVQNFGKPEETWQ